MNKLLSLLTATLFLISACTTSTPSAPSETEDGLSLTDASSVKTLYIRPGTDFDHYKSITVEPVKITYSTEMRSKIPSHRDTDFQFTERELGIFQDRADKGFSAGLDKTNGSDGQLIIRHTLEEFYLTSPVKNLVVPNRSYVQDSSRFNITTEFIDAKTQQVVLRASDKLKTGNLSSNSSNLDRMSSVTYWQDVNRAFRRWGSRINSSLN